MKTKWLALPALLLASAASAAPLQVSTEDYPPLNFQRTPGGPVVGISTDILTQAAKAAGVDLTITLMPWARALANGLELQNNCVYSTFRTAEREPKFKWVGPLADVDTVLFGRADSPKVKSLEEVKAYVVGGYSGDAQTNMLKSKGIKVDEASVDAANPKKLMRKRIDFWISGKVQGPWTAAQEGVTGLVPVLEIEKNSTWLACNKSVDDATVAKLNAAIKKVRDDSMAAITASYVK